jgi:hypothetical protein
MKAPPEIFYARGLSTVSGVLLEPLNTQNRGRADFW